MTRKIREKDSVVHFELPADNLGRMAKFYKQAFAWELTQLGPEMDNYVIAHTTKTDSNNMVEVPGTINGGLFHRTRSIFSPSIVISVKDIQESMKRVTEAGGIILGGKKPAIADDIPGVGLLISFIDTEENRLSMLQPKR